MGKPDALARLRRGAEVVLTIALAWIMADLAWVWLSPDDSAHALHMGGGTKPAGRAAPGVDMRVMTLFDPFNRELAAVPTRKADSKARAPETSLNLKLMGVRATVDGDGGAIILMPDKTERAFAVGEEVIDGVTLAEVRASRVVLSRRGARESLYLDPEAAAREQQLRTVTPAEGRGLPDMESFLAQVRVEPRLDNGRVTGLALYPRGDGGLFARLGLEASDVLVAINGEPVDGPASFARLGERMKNRAQIRLDIERGGSPRTIDVNLEEQKISQ